MDTTFVHRCPDCGMIVTNNEALSVQRAVKFLSSDQAKDIGDTTGYALELFCRECFVDALGESESA